MQLTIKAYASTVSCVLVPCVPLTDELVKKSSLPFDFLLAHNWIMMLKLVWSKLSFGDKVWHYQNNHDMLWLSWSTAWLSLHPTLWPEPSFTLSLSTFPSPCLLQKSIHPLLSTSKVPMEPSFSWCSLLFQWPCMMTFPSPMYATVCCPHHYTTLLVRLFPLHCLPLHLPLFLVPFLSTLPTIWPMNAPLFYDKEDASRATKSEKKKPATRHSHNRQK